MVKMMSSIECRVWTPFSLAVRSSRYQRLPEQLLHLSVLKLDGSSFSVSVARNATVAELKRAIEHVFEFSCEGEGTILWSLVWSHFCLCYQAQKLTNDKACIQNFGIKDGDQLQFVQQMMIETIECKTAKQQSESESDHPGQYAAMLNIIEADDDNNEHLNRQLSTCFEIEEEEEEEEEAISIPEFKLAQFVKGLLTQPKLWYSKGRGLGANTHPSIFPYHSVRS